MAIDANIIAGLRPIGVDTPGIVNMFQQGQARAMQQAGQAQQLQMGQQQMQGGVLKLQQEQRDMAADEAGRKLFAQGSPTDNQIMSTYGPVHGAAILKNRMEAVKMGTDIQDTKTKIAEKEADYAGSMGAMIKASGNDPSVAEMAFQHAEEMGYGKSVAPLRAMLAQNPQSLGPIAQHLIDQSPKQAELATARMQAEARAGATLTGQQREAREAAVTEQTTAELNRKNDANMLANAAQQGPDALAAGLQRLSEAGRVEPFMQINAQSKPADILKLGMTPEQITQAGQAATNATQTATHNAATEANAEALRKQGAQRLGIEGQAQTLREKQFNMTIGAGKDVNGQPIKGPDGKPLTGDAFLNVLDPGYAANVRAYAEGRETQLPRGKELTTFMNAVNQYDPDFTIQRAQTRKAFAPGSKQGDNIASMNTAAVHLDQLGEIAKAMNNGSFQPGSKLFVAAKTMFGDELPTNFAGMKAVVSGEMANALKGNATDIEIANLNKALANWNSMEQTEGVVNTFMGALGQKLNTKQEEYRKYVPNDKTWSPVLPTAQAVLQKHGISLGAAQGAGGTPQSAGKITVTAPDGSVHPFSTQAQADAFKKLAGIQ